MQGRAFCLAAFLLVTGGLGGRAWAADEADIATAAPGLSHRISWQFSTLTNTAWGTHDAKGPGAIAQLGYDLFLTPTHAVGLIAGAGLDYSGYGADADSITWAQLGARYTRRFAVTPSFAPFVSPSLLFGRTGGELTRNDWMTTAGLDLGIEWLAFRHVTFDGRLLDRFSRISGEQYGVWHNGAGFMLGLSVHFPG